MVILTPTLEGIIESFVESIRNTLPDLSTTPISVTREALINPTSVQLSALFDAAKRVSVLQDIFQSTGSDLDALAASYGLIRRGGTASTGVLVLDLTQLETRSSIEVRSGTLVTSSGGSIGGTSFSIVGEFTFSSTQRASFEATASSLRSELDSIGLTNVKLAAQVPIVATSTGTSGNLGSFVLNSASIVGVTTVINTIPTSGGTDVESNSSLRTRLIARFTGNSVGTEANLLSAALSSPGVISGFTALPGDPLMTRDGTIRDESGNVIQAGAKRAVDIYILGTSLNSNTESTVFVQKDSRDILSVDNAILVGQPGGTNTFGFLPIFSISDIVGQESGGTFLPGAPVSDDEGNILIEGNFALIKDVDASDYKIVENIITRERKLATFLNPTTTTYTIIDEFRSSDFANSALSQDKVIFLKNEVEIEEEAIVRGEFNGSDQLRFSNVTEISEVYQEIEITDIIKVEQVEEAPGGVLIRVKHSPIQEIVEVINTRLGLPYTAEIINASQGQILIAGRVPPLAGDLLTITYIWKQVFRGDLNYSLIGDQIDWVGFADERGRTDSVLLNVESLQGSNILSAQPNIPSHLSFEVAGVSDRQTVETNIQGSIINFRENELALKATEPFRFAGTGLNNIGRLFKVSNITKGFDYNTVGYQLQSNRFDPTIRVDSTLLPQQFQLNDRANREPILPGDRIILSRPSRTLGLTTQDDFQDNIESNLAPVFDPTLIDFTPGGVILKTPLLDTDSPITTLSGLITQDLTLSGLIEVTDNLVIGEGIVVDIEPSTVIKVRASDQLDSRISYTQQLRFDPNLIQENTLGLSNLPYEEFVYIYLRPENFPSSFFTIINDQGESRSIRFDRDILTKTIVDSEITFYVNGVRIPTTFNVDLESTLDVNDFNTSIKATLLGAKTGENGLPKFISSRVSSLDKYYIILDRHPAITSNLLEDFTLAVAEDSSITFDRFFYDDQLNALIVEGDILETDGYGDGYDGYAASSTDYILTHFIEEVRRVSIIVEGTLRILGATQQTSVLFTSSAGENSKPGDWEGIIFTPKSNSTNSLTQFKSNLSNVRVRFANNGINIQASDVDVRDSIIRDCLEVGINMSSTLRSVSQFSGSSFNLVLSAFEATTRPGFTTSDDVRIARYPIPETMVTRLSQLPILGQRLSETSYIVNFVEGQDYSVYIDFQRAISIDTTIPSDGIIDHALVSGVDYLIEYDINSGYSLVFLYTTSPKLRRVFNLIMDLQSINRPGSITLDFFAAVRNGIIFNNLIFNTTTGIRTSSLASTSINRNTIHDNRVGINSVSTIASIRNNLITGFESTGITADNESYIQLQRNNIYSASIVEAEQNSITDRDILLRSINSLNITLFVRTPNKFRVGSVIKIGQEEMLVQGSNPDSIIVSRGYNNTVFSTHPSGSEVSIFQLNQIFTVTGINGDYCRVIETDSNGVALGTSIPIEMRQISQNTFRAVFPVNRRAHFYYKYRFGLRGSPIVNETLTKVFLRDHPGTGINDIINIFHEIPLSFSEITPNIENYSADPIYINIPAADFSFPPLASLASISNPIFGSLIQPNPLHRLVGFLEVRIVKNLNQGGTRVPVFSQPLIQSSLIEEVTIVGIDPNNQNINLIPIAFSTSVTEAEADQGATGVFILSEPVTLAESGRYRVSYRRPINLGTSLLPYYIEASISYIFDIESEVIFNDIVFNKDSIGGVIEFSYRVANSISGLTTASISNVATTSPILLEDLGFNEGAVIQVDINLLGNDSSYTPSLVYQFPLLEDFSLTYTPMKDNREYKVLSLQRNIVQDITNILIDAPISTTTFDRVGQDPLVEIFVRKKSDNFDPELEYLIGTGEAISTGNTFIVAHGDLITIKPDADPTDIIRIDYMSFQQGSETLYFIPESQPQITRNIYSRVDSITNSIRRDSVFVLPSIETIGVTGLEQPLSGSTYRASYLFEAPLEGETLTINYVYNEIIRIANQEVELSKGLFTDALVKQVKNVPVRIGISLEIEPTASALAVQTEVSNAIAQLFSGFTDITTVRTLEASSIVRATGDIEGIIDIEVTTLSRNLITGEVASIVFEKRENPILEDGSPRINTIQNGRTI